MPNIQDDAVQGWRDTSYLAAPTRTPKRAGLHDRHSAPTAWCGTATVDRAQRHGLAGETFRRLPLRPEARHRTQS